MRKYLFILTAALVIAGCTKKPAQGTETTESADTMPAAVIQEPIADNPYIDITGVTPSGEELSLGAIIGQTDYVLLDFWASWCGPCRRFIPVLKDIYGSQPAGRLQILSCSVDQDEQAWRTALKEEQMPWLQMREDETHPCADRYQVQYIPHTVLFDKEGKIVGVNLEEPEIAEILLGE